MAKLEDPKSRFPNIVWGKGDGTIGHKTRVGAGRLFLEAERCVRRLAEREKNAGQLRRRVARKNDRLIAECARRLEERFSASQQDDRRLVAYSAVPEEIRRLWREEDVEGELESSEEEEGSDEEGVDAQLELNLRLALLKYNQGRNKTAIRNKPLT